MESTLSKESLNSIPTAFASCSIGYKKEHTLPKRLEAIAAAAFQAIELSFPDILSFANLYLQREVHPTDYDDLCSTANEIKAMCDSHGLKILMLQPFANYEGWPEGSEGWADAEARAAGWIKIMKACGTDMLQVGSTDTDAAKINTSRRKVVADLQRLADRLEAEDKTFRLAYENWCWSTHAPTWKDAWEIVKAVDRPNVGLCLDTFQTAGSEWADPTTESGLIETETSVDALRVKFDKSLRELSDSIPPEKIYLLQISDGYKPRTPLSKESDESGLRPKGRWSHDFRPIPFDGFLPVASVARAVLMTGFRGWFSYEVFDSGDDGKGKEYELKDFAKAAMKSHKKLLSSC